MSTNSHLVNTASKLIITDQERSIIDAHILALDDKLRRYFTSGELKSKLVFGSYSRRTLMPRRADPSSDVDYMIVFENTTYSTKSYLKWLKDFADAKYSSSEIYQSHPTIVLELSKIKIELVPAIKNAYDEYKIPAPNSNYEQWLTTHPNQFNNLVSNKNTSEKNLIRPLIRLMKYWNALNNYVFSSYELEQLIVNSYYGVSCNSLWDYLYSFVIGLSTYNTANWKIEKIQRVQDICTKTKNFIFKDMPISAEVEIKKSFPEFY